jgi:hypothetical protein
MALAKIAMWFGGILTLFGTNIPNGIAYSLRLTDLKFYEVNHEAITIGLVCLVGGFVAYAYEKD